MIDRKLLLFCHFTIDILFVSKEYDTLYVRSASLLHKILQECKNKQPVSSEMNWHGKLAVVPAGVACDGEDHAGVLVR